jgi:uncharacterized lipoprotein YddW (UPF0748 family)
MKRIIAGVIGTWLCIRIAAPAAAASPVPTTFSSDAAAQAAWRAGAETPAARADASGIRLFCPFQDGRDRVYWDWAGRLDLHDASSLQLTLTAIDPDSVRTLSVYFKSGEGWYHWSRPVRGSGRQTVTIVKSDCSIEGAPAGWQQIDAVRISPWRGQSRAAAFVIHELAARRDALVLVQGTTSLPNPGERAFAQRTAQRISQWLTDAGIPHGAIDDDAVIAGGLDAARVAILCYVENPPPRELEALRAFVARGGKLVVFYSGSASLARMMGFRLGRFERTDDAGRWAALRFANPEALGTPERVHDHAWTRIPVAPELPGTRVVAVWEDAAGRASADAACLAGPHGYWFTHLPRAEDDAGKQRMLLAMVGAHDPAAWQAAARKRLREAGRVGPFGDLPAALDGIPRMAPAARQRRVADALRPARDLHRQATAAFAAGRYRQALTTADALHDAVQGAYGLAHAPAPGERRAVWDHDALGWYPGDWPRSTALLAESGMTAIFPNLLWAGKAHYPSRTVPTSQSFDRYGDQARQCVDAARTHGLEVHAWVVCWNLENAPAPLVERMRRENRLQQDASGREKIWLCPHQPANTQYMLAAIRELAAAYPLHGIHLDYIRMPDANHCFCPASRRAFEASLGRAAPAWPQAVRNGGPLAAAWTQWRAAQITAFVQQTRQTLRAVRPTLQLSAAVYPQYPSCRDSIGQDWGRWLQQDLVDFVCPMSYTEDIANFRAGLDGYLALPGARGRILPGIGVTSSESRLQPHQVLDQITAARTANAPGFILFNLDHTLRRETLPLLRLGATALSP